MELADWTSSKNIYALLKGEDWMNENILIGLLRQTLFLIIKVSAPMLLVSLVIGLIVSILQTITSIQEQTLTFVPKFLGIFLTLALFGNWIFRSVTQFFEYLALNFEFYIRG